MKLARVEVIEKIAQLAALDPPFSHSLAGEFDLAALAGRVCPVMLRDGRAAIFHLEHYAHSDQLPELERMIQARHYRLMTPARFTLSAPLLLAVARGQITAATLRQEAPGRSAQPDSVLVDLFHDLVRYGVRHRASDLHINVMDAHAESAVRYSIDGWYVSPDCFRRIPSTTLLEVLAVAWMRVRGGNGAVFDPRTEQQGRLTVMIDEEPVLLRWASLACDAGPSVCLRILHRRDAARHPTLAELGFLPSHIEALDRARTTEGGAVVLAGVVGSGKSTTIATLMRRIPSTRKIVTLEDPVEYLIEGALQNTIGRSLGEDGSAAFDAKLKTLKRSAMNDLLLGEVRDAETGRAFADLAGCGINLYTTTHTGGAATIPQRLASDCIGVSRDLLATPGVLKLLVYQALVPKLCPVCALPAVSLLDGADDAGGIWRSPAWWRRWADRLEKSTHLGLCELKVRNPSGCEQCAQPELRQLRGTRGRSVVAEMIEPSRDPFILDCIRRSDNLALCEHLQGRARDGDSQAGITHRTAAQCALHLAATGVIDPRGIEGRFGSFENCGQAGNFSAGPVPTDLGSDQTRPPLDEMPNGDGRHA